MPYSNAPAGLRLSDFRAVVDSQGGPVKSARLGVVIKPVGGLIAGYATFAQELLYLCEVAELPGRGFIAIDGIHYYGPAFKMPAYTEYDDINFTFICRTASLERSFFDDWMTVINPPNTFDFNYRDEYRAEIDVYQFADFGTNGPEPVYCITMLDAYPYMVSPQPGAWSDEQFQRLVVSFTYYKWIQKGTDPQAGNGAADASSFSLVEGSSVTPAP